MLVYIGLALGAGVARYGGKVLGEGDFRLVDVFVVGAEYARVDFDVVGSVDLVEGGRPVDGEVVGVLARGAALLEYFGVFGDSIIAVEGVHVGFELPGENKWVNIFDHITFVSYIHVGGGDGRQGEDEVSWLHSGDVVLP
jgi:hypothetical protein